MLRPGRFNTSHVVNHLSFGDKYPGKAYPLDGHTALAATGERLMLVCCRVLWTGRYWSKQDS